MEQYALFILLALVAEVIGTVSGFGSSILFVPMATLFFDFETVLGITAIFHVFSNITKMVLFKKGINKNIALKLGIPAIVFVVLGAWLTAYIPQKEMELAMNIMLLLLAIYLLFNFNKKLNQTNTNLYLGGVLSGFMAGLVGSGGAIRGIVLAAFNLGKEVFIATSALIDLGVDLSRTIVYVAQGYVATKYLVLIPFLIGVSIVGSYLGKRILAYTSERVFRYLVLCIIIGTSVFQLGHFLVDLR